MKRLIVVCNSRSSHYKKVDEEVIQPARQLNGWMIARFEVAQESVDANAKRLAQFLVDGDLVIAAGGDGTATVAINGVMFSSAKDVRLGVAGYGNFNDVANCFGNLSFEEIIAGEVKEVWPLQCSVNGKLWRYAMCYVTVGMFAEACAVFDEPKHRKVLRRGGRKISYSLRSLASWWMREHRHDFLPNFSLGDASGDSLDMVGVSDYLAINSPSVAKIMKSDAMFSEPNEFVSTTGKLSKFWKLAGFMLKSVLKKIPSERSDYDVLSFSNPADVMIQAEGEYVRLEQASRIEVQKSKKALLAIVRKK